MREPLVSVKMITYNHAPYIKRAIESVLGQETNFRFELVIGEDCSTDGTREIVLEYESRFPEIIRVVTSDANVGMHANSRRVSAAVSGKYIAWCEGDDYWTRVDKLQIQVEYLEAHPDCGLVSTDCDFFFTGTGRVQQSFFAAESCTDPEIADIVAGRGGILTCTAVARRSLVEKVLLDDPYLHTEGNFPMGDTQLWAELSTLSRIHRIEESMAVHNILPESATQSRDKSRSLRFWIANSEMCLYLCEKHSLPEYVKNIHVSILRKSGLKLAFYESDRTMARAIRARYPRIGFKDYLWYLSAMYPGFGAVFNRLLVLMNRGEATKDGVSRPATEPTFGDLAK